MPNRQRLFAAATGAFGGFLLLSPLVALAQTPEPTPTLQPTPTLAAAATPEAATPEASEEAGPAVLSGGAIPQVHEVQSGENLTVIATTYGVTLEALMAANGLTDADILQIGQELIIPGGTGDAVSAVYTAQVGDTLAGIAADFNTTVEDVAAANRTASLRPPLAGGQSVAVISRTGSDTPRPRAGRPHIVEPGETLLGLAARYDINPGELAGLNALGALAALVPGQRLIVPDESVLYRELPGAWVDVRVRPEPVGQGSTVSVYVQNLNDGRPSGRLGDVPLQFAPFGNGYVALAGIDAFTEPGVYDLQVSDEDGAWEPLNGWVLVNETAYDTQYIEVGEALDGLLDPALRADEDAFLATIYSDFTEPTQWSGVFRLPLETPLVSAGYGGRRSYNGGPIAIYHTGIDYAAAEGTQVVAPAAGTVVFSDTLELRGNVLIIDHGLGVMTGYYHLMEILVAPGDEVAAGQPIGRVGSTGLSSGSHLHWDVRVLDVPVDGIVWTQQAFP
jgi:murein DD-endopeptidase MepM/ murein hydrolase activator NlpD